MRFEKNWVYIKYDHLYIVLKYFSLIWSFIIMLFQFFKRRDILTPRVSLNSYSSSPPFISSWSNEQDFSLINCHVTSSFLTIFIIRNDNWTQIYWHNTYTVHKYTIFFYFFFPFVSWKSAAMLSLTPSLFSFLITADLSNLYPFRSLLSPSSSMRWPVTTISWRRRWITGNLFLRQPPSLIENEISLHHTDLFLINSKKYHNCSSWYYNVVVPWFFFLQKIKSKGKHLDRVDFLFFEI